MTAWGRLRALVAGTGDALDEPVPPAAALEEGLDDVADAAAGAGAAGKKAGKGLSGGAEEALTGWAAVTAELSDYSKGVMETGAQIGDALVGAFQGAESAIDRFVKTGKLSFRDLTVSIIADRPPRGVNKLRAGARGAMRAILIDRDG